MADRPPLHPLPLRLGALAGLAFVGLALIEGAARLADGNAFPRFGAYTVRDGELRLRADTATRLRRADGTVTTVRTGARGLRRPDAGVGLVVGDSQALGLGVEDGDTFAARSGLRNAGVPGHGVRDAVAHARELVPALGITRVVVCLNQANDWLDGLRPAGERHVVAGGWLGSPDGAATLAARFWASPLSRLHALALPALLVEGTPSRPTPPDAAEVGRLTAAFAAEVRALQADLPGVAVEVLFLPADAATSEARAARSPLGLPGRPWEDRSLRDGVHAAFAGVPLVDPTDALADPASFLDDDYHLSELGHRAVAEALSPGGRP